jgi:hypothetical protein
MSMQERGYICEKGRTHGNLGLSALGRESRVGY